MKEELYRKIYINSEADLPKEDKDYIVHSRYFGWIDQAVWKNFENANYPEYNQYIWLLNYDWYLQPIEPVEAEKDEKSLFDGYSDFVFKAFPDASSNDHLKKLIIEAREAMQDNRDVMEYADCLGAIYGATTKAGFTYDELIRAGFEKLEINKTRKWAKLDDGTYQHIKAEKQTYTPNPPIGSTTDFKIKANEKN